jgi:hypothetical protein
MPYNHRAPSALMAMLLFLAHASDGAMMHIERPLFLRGGVPCSWAEFGVPATANTQARGIVVVPPASHRELCSKVAALPALNPDGIDVARPGTRFGAIVVAWTDGPCGAAQKVLNVQGAVTADGFPVVAVLFLPPSAMGAPPGPGVNYDDLLMQLGDVHGDGWRVNVSAVMTSLRHMRRIVGAADYAVAVGGIRKATGKDSEVPFEMTGWRRNVVMTLGHML